MSDASEKNGGNSEGEGSENEDSDASEQRREEEEIKKIKERQSEKAKEFLEDTMGIVNQEEQDLKKRDEDNVFIADELEKMFSKVSSKNGHNKLKKKWGNENSSSDSEIDESGPKLPSKYLGEQVKKLTKEEEALRQISQREKFEDFNKDHNRE